MHIDHLGLFAYRSNWLAVLAVNRVGHPAELGSMLA